MSENEQPNQPQAGEQYTPPEPNPAPQNNLFNPPELPQPQEPQEPQAEQFTPPEPPQPQEPQEPQEPQAEQYTPPEPPQPQEHQEPQAEQFTPPEPPQPQAQQEHQEPQTEQYTPPEPPQPQEHQEPQTEQYTPSEPQVPQADQYTPSYSQAPQAEQYTPSDFQAPQAAQYVPQAGQYTPPGTQAPQEQTFTSAPYQNDGTQPNQAAPQSRQAQSNQPSAVSPIIASFKNYFTQMVPLLKGYPEKILVKAYKDSQLWIIGLVFATLSSGLLGANGIGAVMADVSNRITMRTYGLVPVSLEYGFFKWLTFFIVFVISGALFVALRALAIWLSTIIMGQQASFKDCLNLAAFTYSWMFALSLLTSFLVILSLSFTSLAILLAIPIVIASELFTFTGLQTMGEFKRSPIVAYAVLIGCAHILSGLITWLMVHGVFQ